MPAPGHTFGHTVIEVESKGDKLLYLADTALHPIHLEYPHWTAVVDQFPEQVVETRISMYERASQQEALVLLFHFLPFPSLGYITWKDQSWRWIPKTDIG